MPGRLYRDIPHYSWQSFRWIIHSRLRLLVGNGRILYWFFNLFTRIDLIGLIFHGGLPYILCHGVVVVTATLAATSESSVFSFFWLCAGVAGGGSWSPRIVGWMVRGWTVRIRTVRPRTVPLRMSRVAPSIIIINIESRRGLFMTWWWWRVVASRIWCLLTLVSAYPEVTPIITVSGLEEVGVLHKVATLRGHWFLLEQTPQ